jgi:hypothetical protein
MELGGWQVPVSSPTMHNDMTPWTLPLGRTVVRVEAADLQDADMSRWWVVFWPVA